ncbi:AAA family ATPase [Humibacillus xanthopallidus]|uniref:Putative kinase n=1 Tax=Humibacillus xanthopallidus TaxID=412689 RepID=A0A543I3D1_9MICO|nr:AAA family ATPase [Humibacillus xanthopallidus]TQM65061.1 putative kinase [Humibacillus xanthopallidus]
MSRLVLINGPPGSGKSPIALSLAQDRPLTLDIDVDAIKHTLGRWAADPSSGLHARRLSLALAGEHLRSGFDVVLVHYLAKTPFIEELEHLAGEVGAQFHEFVLDLDTPSLAARLAARATNPDRPEHQINNRLVGPEDAALLIQSLQALREQRPGAIWVDATGSLAATVSALRSRLDQPVS